MTMIIKRKLYSKLSGLPKAVRNIKFKTAIKKMPKRDAAEKAISLGRKAERAEVYWKSTTPGQKLADGVGVIAKNPVGSVTWAATAATPAPSSLLAPAAEKGARKLFPKYGAIAENIGKTYDVGPVRRIITAAGNALVAIPM